MQAFRHWQAIVTLSWYDSGTPGPANRKGSKASTIKLISHQPTLNYHEFNKEEDDPYDPTYAHVSYFMDNGHHPRRPLIQGW